MTRIATSRKMGQLRARHFSTVEICLPFSECVFKSDIIQGLVGIPRWGLWLPRQHWRQTQPMKWMCQITQCHPLGESCRCVCVCGCQCVQYVCRYWGFYFYRSEHVVTYISSHPLPHLSLPSHSSLLSSSSFMQFLFLFFFHKMQSEQLYLCLTQTWLARFLFLLLWKCHNLDYSLISNHLRSYCLELCLSAD